MVKVLSSQREGVCMQDSENCINYCSKEIDWDHIKNTKLLGNNRPLWNFVTYGMDSRAGHRGHCSLQCHLIFYKYKCGTGTCQLNGKNKPFSDAWWEKGLSKLYFCFTIIITDIFLFPETSCSPEKWGFSHFRRGSIFYIKIIFILYWEIIFLPIPSTYNGLSLETKQAKTIGEFKWRLKNEKKNWELQLSSDTENQN